MQVVCVGAGPAGLYLGILLRRWAPDCEVVVYDRNPPGHAEGWGIVFWRDLLETLRRCDPESAGAIEASAVAWPGQALMRAGRALSDLRAGGYGLDRRRLLEILAERAAGLGVRLRYGTEIGGPAELPPADLVVASDGAGSRLREAQSHVFRPRVVTGRNRYIWLGAARTFEAFTFGVAETAEGPVWFHAYPSGRASTFIVECAAGTWTRLGFGGMSSDEAAQALSRVFARELAGCPLMSGGARWQSFRTVRTDTFVGEGMALVGDAAHTAHFSLGSGTQLAIDDAVALATALVREPGVPAALRAYDAARRGPVARAQARADRSAAWFEALDRYAALPDEAFFDLLLHRRSRLLGVLPPTLAWRAHRASRASALLRALRRTGARLHRRLTEPRRRGGRNRPGGGPRPSR
ncbi:FAD-dependent monooxygenase [Phenylobacterium sp.]|uniref:FAD-dependent monooxygenase n=1 Tax=Phenylobacterium sp. TaxID=1871053 RepID=UPI0035AE70AA